MRAETTVPQPSGLSPAQRRSLDRRVRSVLALEDEVSRLSDDEIRSEIATIVEKLTDEGADLVGLQVQVFALVRESAKRVLGEFPYPVQVLGGLVIADGCIAEMATGEGKTLTATMPATWLALFKEGVHVATANDYLASRDAETLAPLYGFLGLTTGVSSQGMGVEQRKEAYACDITYSTAQQLAFDYLIDNLVDNLVERAQRLPSAAIIDEADSLLIDEARNPLIISAPDTESGVSWSEYARLAAAFRPEHYEADLADMVANLTSEGVTLVEGFLEVDNLYDHPRHVHHVNAALNAQVLFRRDIDYIVATNSRGEQSVVIVDEHTGRTQEDRRFQDSIHEALEAKEGLSVKVPSVTQASTTLQSFFARYGVLGGMTGTALSDAPELERTYGTPVAKIPTHRPVIRIDQPDLLYATKDAKMRAVTAEVAERYAKGQPVLVGTSSVEESEELSDLLVAAQVPHAVLNARRHTEEALVVAQAGRRGAVTVATNMAGRGVDIKLGGSVDLLVQSRISEDPDLDPEAARLEIEEQCREERKEVLSLGGLYVLGTARYSSRRVDDQLRGRSGRQGEPGESRFYLSCEDELVVLFGGAGLKTMVARLSGDPDLPVSHNALNRIVKRSQAKVEGLHSDQRRSLLDYDRVVSAQRNAVYKWRDSILTEDFDTVVDTWLRSAYTSALLGAGVGTPTSLEGEALLATIRPAWPVNNLPLPLAEDPLGADVEEVVELMTGAALADLQIKFSSIEDPILRLSTLRHVLLQFVDQAWANQLVELELLRSGIQLSTFSQLDPRMTYSLEAHDLFQDMLADARTRALNLMWSVSFTVESAVEELSDEAGEVDISEEAFLEEADPSAGGVDQDVAVPDNAAGENGEARTTLGEDQSDVLESEEPQVASQPLQESPAEVRKENL